MKKILALLRKILSLISRGLDSKKLNPKIKKMDNQQEMIRLLSAGATVRHISPFERLPTHKNDKELTADFYKKWVVPYYMTIASYGPTEWIESIREIKEEITIDVCLSLLGEFNWRPKLVGAYFAAVKNYTGLIDIIGNHFLKSEVCCVGHIYALVLAFFNNGQSTLYLNKYLDYYLTKPDLYYDQKFAMTAILYLDKQNNTDYFSHHLPNWNNLKAEREKLQEQRHQEQLKQHPEPETATSAYTEVESKEFQTDFFDVHIAILNNLSERMR
jgi:hypothetical protein